MEVNTEGLVGLVGDLIDKTYRQQARWKLQDDAKSYQYSGNEAVALITSENEGGAGPYSLIFRDSTGIEIGAVNEAQGNNGEPADWNSLLSYLYSLAKRREGPTADELKKALDL